MGPWGPDMPLRPEEVIPLGNECPEAHCGAWCCWDAETCHCDCGWCDCRYGERMGS